MRRRGGALVLIAIGALFVAPDPVSAAMKSVAETAVPASALGVVAVGAAPNSPGFALAADPGGSAKRTFVVTNHSSDLRLGVRLDPVGSPATGTGSNSTGAHSTPASWLTLSDVVETLEPGASATVTIAILVPADAIPGDVVAGVRVHVDQAVRVADGSPVPGNPSVSLPVAIKVNGAPTAQVSVVDVRAVQEQGKNLLEIEFRNVGATSMLMSGRVEVGGAHPQTLPVRANAAPLSGTTVRVPWVKPPGSKGVAVSVSAGDARGDQASWNGLVGAAPSPATAPGRSEAAPVAALASPHRSHTPFSAFVLLALALALTWFLFELTRARRRRRTLAARVTVPTIGATAVGASASGRVPASEQIDGVAIQLAALVGAIDRLVERIDASAEPTEPTESSAIAPVPSGAATWVVDPAYPYDWPTEEQLDRFLERRRGAGFDLR